MGMLIACVTGLWELKLRWEVKISSQSHGVQIDG